MAKVKLLNAKECKAKLAAMREAITRSTNKPLVTRVAIETMGPIMLGLAQATANAHQQPTGKPWAPTRSGRPASLGIFGGIRLLSFTRKYALKSNAAYSQYHNSGASNRRTKPDGTRNKWVLPKRSFLPKRAIPLKWLRPSVIELQKELEKVLMGGL